MARIRAGIVGSPSLSTVDRDPSTASLSRRSRPTAADSWILIAVVYGGGKHGADLRGIVAAADYVNHAIPTYQEVRGALWRLLNAGLVRVELRAGPALPGRFCGLRGHPQRSEDLEHARRGLFGCAAETPGADEEVRPLVRDAGAIQGGG